MSQTQTDPLADYSYLAAYTIQVCELLAYFDKDVRWVWKRPVTLLQLNFILVRYGSLGYQAALIYQHFRSKYVTYTEHDCFPWGVMRTVNPYIFVALTQMILIDRVFNLYQRDKWVLRSLLCLFIPGLVCTITTFSIALSKPMSYTRTCDPIDLVTPWIFVITSILPFFLDLSMITLTVRRIVRSRRMPHSESLLRLILRDGTWCFVVIWASITGAMLMTVFGAMFPAYVVANSWLITNLSFMATHLVMNMRRFADARELAQEHHSSEAPPVYRGALLTSGIPVELSAFTRYQQSDPYLHFDDLSKSTLSRSQP